MKSQVCTTLELEMIRREIGYGKRDLALILGIPERTVHSYFSGERSIPEQFVDALMDLKRRDQEFMEGLPSRIDAALEEQFGPGGKFMSDAIKEDAT